MNISQISNGTYCITGRLSAHSYCSCSKVISAMNLLNIQSCSQLIRYRCRIHIFQLVSYNNTIECKYSINSAIYSSKTFTHANNFQKIPVLFKSFASSLNTRETSTRTKLHISGFFSETTFVYSRFLWTATVFQTATIWMSVIGAQCGKGRWVTFFPNGFSEGLLWTSNRMSQTHILCVFVEMWNISQRCLKDNARLHSGPHIISRIMCGRYNGHIEFMYGWIYILEEWGEKQWSSYWGGEFRLEL